MEPAARAQEYPRDLREGPVELVGMEVEQSWHSPRRPSKRSPRGRAGWRRSPWTRGPSKSSLPARSMPSEIVHRDRVADPRARNIDRVATRAAAEIRDGRSAPDPSGDRFDPRKTELRVARVRAEAFGDLVVGGAIAPRDVVALGTQNVVIAQIEATIVVIAVPPAPIPRIALFSPSPRMPKA